MLEVDTTGLGGAFAACRDRGQPMQMHSTSAPFYPLDPQPEDIYLEDIVHSLSLICRYGGHCAAFYSVAQHCVHASRLPEAKGYEREVLMHDAAEAYIGDMINPLKRIIPQYLEIEAGIEAAVAARFGLRYPWPGAVKVADRVMLATEKRDLMRPADWGPMPEPRADKIRPWSPEIAAHLFRARCLQLEIV